MQNGLQTDDVAQSPMGWVPRAALNYLAHTEGGLSIRALARKAGCHASTVSRQVRAFEARRDDLLVDEALRKLGAHVQPADKIAPGHHDAAQAARAGHDAAQAASLTEARLHEEARRVLKDLSGAGAILAVATGMEKAAVMQDTPDGPRRVAVVDRDVAEAMALNGWIGCDAPGRVSKYRITGQGRAMLAQLLAEAENDARAHHGREMVTERACRPDTGDAPSPRRVRYGAPDTPLVGLARRRDKDGSRFLSEDLVRAGERLREDFELADLSAQDGQDWERLACAEMPEPGGARPGASATAMAARARVIGVLRDLGPGLADVTVRCCCYLEGLETTERKMGWSARSGKIVLRIALQRLKRHYEALGDEAGLMG